MAEPRKRKIEKEKEDDDDTPSSSKKVKGTVPYEISEVPGKHIFGKKFMNKYKDGMATDSVYDVSIVGPEWKGKKISDLTGELTQMWRDVLQTVRDDNALPTDLMRIHINHRELNKGDIKIPLQKVGEITPETIMNCIATVMQSYDHLDVDNVLEISVGLIKFPRGEGRAQIINLDSLADKKSMTIINNKDGKCLARALAVSEAWEQKQKWDLKKTGAR